MIIRFVPYSINKYRDTVTTDSSGFISVTMTNPYIVLSAWADQGDVIVLPFAKMGINTSGNVTWWFRVCNENMVARTSYHFDLNFTYI